MEIDRRTAIFLIVIILVGVSIPASSYALAYLEVCLGTAHSDFLTLVMTKQGFNGSITHTDAWPVLSVGRCDKVTVHLENLDTEAHGFAITHYLNSGVKVQPGQSLDVVVNVNRSGSFLIYCNILCSIHLYMQNGRLNVT